MTSVCDQTPIVAIRSHDRRFTLAPGAGTDAKHTNPNYAYAVTTIELGSGIRGTGLAFTLGAGTEVVCSLIDYYGDMLTGRDLGEVMTNFGTVYRELADDSQLRWIGPHKGAIHLALASVVNACFDAWAKSRGLPLWALLLELEPVEIVDLIDFESLEDVLTRAEALEFLVSMHATRFEREAVLDEGYPGYDTSVGWLGYSQSQIEYKVREAFDSGFTAVKLKVGSADIDDDVRRASSVREVIGDASPLMLDANQSWSVPRARQAIEALSVVNPYWVEEPTHPDDLLGHAQIAQWARPIRIAAGEHLPNQVVFKNFIQADAMHFVQADCVRLGGVSEFIAVSLLARLKGLPVVPHVGDMGQIHQHLVLFNHVALGNELLFLEHIPHLRDHFIEPARIVDGRYVTPQRPGSSSDLVAI